MFTCLLRVYFMNDKCKTDCECDKIELCELEFWMNYIYIIYLLD